MHRPHLFSVPVAECVRHDAGGLRDRFETDVDGLASQIDNLLKERGK